VVEQRPFKPKVVGSIPTAPTNNCLFHNGLVLRYSQRIADINNWSQQFWLLIF
jgi:hypothetical protein